MLGYKTCSHKDWISADSLKTITDRKKKKAELNISHTRAEKPRAQEAYANAARTAKNSIRADKKNSMEALATEAKEATQHGNMKELYTITKKLCGKFSDPKGQLRTKMERLFQVKSGRGIGGENTLRSF